MPSVPLLFVLNGLISFWNILCLEIPFQTALRPWQEWPPLNWTNPESNAWKQGKVKSWSEVYLWWSLAHLMVSIFHAWENEELPVSGMVIYRKEKIRFLPARNLESSPIMSEALVGLIPTPTNLRVDLKMTWSFFFPRWGGIYSVTSAFRMNRLHPRREDLQAQKGEAVLEGCCQAWKQTLFGTGPVSGRRWLLLSDCSLTKHQGLFSGKMFALFIRILVPLTTLVWCINPAKQLWGSVLQTENSHWLSSNAVSLCLKFWQGTWGQ